ncbi:MAG: tetratricopeptide repeat-containing sensor histidine kinase, partial [Flammeovirgaceae bacterium]
GMGNTYLKLRQFDKAFNYLQESLLLNDKDSISFEGRALNDLGNYFFAIKSFQKAQEYYTKSLKLRQAHKLKDAVLSSKLGIARTHIQLGEFQKAQDVLEDTLVEGNELGVKGKLFPIHQLLSEVYEAKGQLDKSLKHYRLYHAIKDQVIDEKSRKRIEQVQTMHALILEKKENESEYYRVTTKKLQKQKEQIIQQNNALIEKEKLLQIAYKEAVTAEEEARQHAEEIKTVNETLAKTKNEVEALYRKEVETSQKLNQALAELKRTHRQLVHAEKMASLGQLTAGLAHEINNPINFIYVGIQNLQTLYGDIKHILNEYDSLNNKKTLEQVTSKLQEIELLKQELHFIDFEDDIAATLKDIGTGVKRTKDIVHSLRVFARGGEGKFEMANLHENIDSTLVIIHNQYKHRIEVIKNYSSQLNEVECNIGQLNQVIMNVLVNAGHAIEGEGKVSIATSLIKESDTEKVCITISDTGKGMTEEVKSRIFEPFFTTKEVGKGTGLGLAISHGIIERHHGKIDVESTVDVGTTFTITLPVVQNRS